MMDTLDIIRAMKCNKKLKCFIGVFACNKLPRHILKKPACLIINTDPSNKPGTHWVAIYIPVKGKCEYFDSFGLKPKIRSIYNFIMRQSSSYLCNQIQLQSFISTVCGNYCCEFLLHRCQGKTMRQFIQIFKGNNTLINDYQINKNFKQHFLKM